MDALVSIFGMQMLDDEQKQRACGKISIADATRSLFESIFTDKKKMVMLERFNANPQP